MHNFEKVFQSSIAEPGFRKSNENTFLKVTSFISKLKTSTA